MLECKLIWTVVVLNHLFNYSFSANNLAQKQKRKTLTGQDVLSAMEEMEFEQFTEPLKKSLEGIVF